MDVDFGFIERDKMSSIFDLHNTDIDDIFDFFISGKGKTAYVEINGKMHGIITVRDIIRGFDDGCESLEFMVNREYLYFSSLESTDIRIADLEGLFMKNGRYIRELPILKNNRLIGTAYFKEADEGPWLNRDLIQSRWPG